MALWDNAACMELDRALAAQGIRYSAPTLGSTLGSPPGGNGHTDGSNHYPSWWGGPPGSTGQARDYGDRASDCNAIAEFFVQFARGPNYIISELIWTRSKMPLSRNGIYYKRGVAYTPSFKLARQHNDHDHVAIAVGRHLPAWVFRGQPIPQPQPAPTPKGFLMALSDKQQGDVYNWLREVREKSFYGDYDVHPNYGDLVNKVAEEVMKQLGPDLKAIRAYLTASP